MTSCPRSVSTTMVTLPIKSVARLWGETVWILPNLPRPRPSFPPAIMSFASPLSVLRRTLVGGLVPRQPSPVTRPLLRLLGMCCRRRRLFPLFFRPLALVVPDSNRLNGWWSSGRSTTKRQPSFWRWETIRCDAIRASLLLLIAFFLSGGHQQWQIHPPSTLERGLARLLDGAQPVVPLLRLGRVACLVSTRFLWSSLQHSLCAHHRPQFYWNHGAHFGRGPTGIKNEASRFIHTYERAYVFNVLNCFFLAFRWIGWRDFFRHKRTVIKVLALSLMFVEAVVVLIRANTHFRVSRALRPIFLIDNHFCGGVRRFIRQILQSLPPIIDMLGLVFFVMLIYR